MFLVHLNKQNMQTGVLISALVLVAVLTLHGSASSKTALHDHRDPAATPSALTPRGDCVVDLALFGDSKALIRYTISCAVRKTKILVAVGPGAGQELTRVSRRIPPKGPGALSPARCTLVGDEIACRARMAGPVTFEGWLMVKPGTRCRDHFAISVEGYSHRLYPLGCPDATRPPLPSVAQIVQFRQQHGLDLDLNADAAAIEARAIALREALRRGDPSALVARRIWGVPLRDIDLRELEYRLYYNIEGSAALNEWFDLYASGTYAGSWIDEAAGGLIYVRFIGDQDAQVTALRNSPGILAPERIVGYGVPALYSMAELRDLAELIWSEAEGPLGLRGLINGISIDVKENKVSVGVCDPESVAPILTARFGSEAPLVVVRMRPPVLKSPKAKKPLRRCGGLTGSAS